MALRKALVFGGRFKKPGANDYRHDSTTVEATTSTKQLDGQCDQTIGTAKGAFAKNQSIIENILFCIQQLHKLITLVGWQEWLLDEHQFARMHSHIRVHKSMSFFDAIVQLDRDSAIEEFRSLNQTHERKDV